MHFSETPMVHNRVSWTWNLLNQYLMDKKKMELGRTGGNPIPVQGRQMGIAALGLGDHPQWPPDPPPPNTSLQFGPVSVAVPLSVTIVPS